MDVCVFVKNYLPPHIKNKIMQYAIKSIMNIRKYLLENKKMSIMDCIYNTKNKVCIYNLPFKIDYISIGANFFVYDKLNELIISRTITKNISRNQKELYYSIGCMLHNNIIKSSNINIYKNINKINYINKIIITENEYGIKRINHNYVLLIYNRGFKRKIMETYNTYGKSNKIYLCVSPLNFLWKIRDGIITMKELKLLASQNKIKGRSKLKTRQDYINVFMKL